MKSGDCTKTDAEAKAVAGCRDKIVEFAETNSKGIMYAAIAAILLQVSTEAVLWTASMWCLENGPSWPTLNLPFRRHSS